jgi:glycosyltransferase involved in cell wall biosynthesis
MRVLWFTDNSSVGTNRQKTKEVGSAWIVSLEAEITKISGVELGIAFTCRYSDVSVFTVGTTQYYPIQIPPFKNKFREIKARYTHEIESEDIVGKYLKAIDEFKPDVIHIFGSEHNFGLIASKTSVPCIIHLQGNLTVNGLKWYSGLTENDILKYSDKWLIARGHGLYHYYFINKNASVRERRIFKECKYFMGRTDWDRRLSSVLSPGSKYFHCEEIMRPRFYSNHWTNPSDRKSFVIVSTIRNNIYKGFETIFESKRILSENFPDLDIHWRIAGLSENDEIARLVSKKYRAAFSNFNIELLGSLNENDLIENLLSANLFVHASHIENSPNSVCEAMLLGMPVIASYVGGTPSILTDRKEGLLVQDGDPYALSGAILDILRDSNYATELGSKARERAFNRNQPDKIVKEVVRIYSSVIDEG